MLNEDGLQTTPRASTRSNAVRSPREGAWGSLNTTKNQFLTTRSLNGPPDLSLGCSIRSQLSHERGNPLTRLGVLTCPGRLR